MTNDKVKIFVTYKDKHKIIKSDIITPIQTGRAIADEKFEGMIGDDTGDNISKDNPKYNELSAQYWVWKHYEEIGNPEYVGFMHYRRHFLFDNKFKTNSTWLKNSNVYNVKNLSEDYCMNNFSSDKIYSTLEDTDILVLNKYDVKNMGVKTCREEYIKNIPCTHGEIFDKLLISLGESLPEYAKDIEFFKSDSKQYLCNMFIMKKDVFMAYSKFLFEILSLLDSKIDSSLYCEQEMRFLGYMGEFLLTIFINHNKNKFKVKEIPGCFIENCEDDVNLKPVFKDNSVAIAMSSSNEYAPYLATYLKSIIDNASKFHKYDIIVFERDISKRQKKIISSLAEGENISIRFFNVRNLLKNFKLHISHWYFNEACYYRIFAPKILSSFSKIIFTDIDIICNDDIYEMSNVNIDNNCIMAACLEPIWEANIIQDVKVNGLNIKEYSKNILKADNPFIYYNTGVVVMDVKRCNEINFSQTVLNECLENKFLYQEQCGINKLYQDKISKLDSSWNCGVYPEEFGKITKFMTYNTKQELSKIKVKKMIHYLGFKKPWFYPESEQAELWWAYARKTPFYEIILKRMCDKGTVEIFHDIRHYRGDVLKYWKYKILQNFVFGKTRTRYVNKKHIYKAKVAQGKIFK